MFSGICILPWLEQSFEDTLEAARDADLIVGHPIAFATPTVAEYLKKPWISIALQPSIFLSAYDPPVISGAPFLHPFFRSGLVSLVCSADTRKTSCAAGALR